MARIRIVLPIALVVLAGCGAAGEILARNTLHVARLHPPDLGIPITIQARDGVRLRGSWAAPEGGSSRCVMVMHGVGDSRASAMGLAPLFVGHGYAILAPDARGHGDSGGELVTYGLVEKYDTLAWVRCMRSQGCQKIYGLGESMGAAVLLQAAAAQPAFEAIVAESSFADIQDAAEHRLKKTLPLPRPLATPLSWIAAVNGRWYTRLVYGFDLAETSPLKAIAGIKAPILLIHGTADDQTPPDHSQRLAAANPRVASLWLVKGAGHCGAYAREPQKFEQRVLAWFQDH